MFESGFVHRRREPESPHLRRWMAFVDGENLTMCAQRLAKSRGERLVESRFYSRDVYTWLPQYGATELPVYRGRPSLTLQPSAIRAYYYTSVSGDQPKIESVRDTLWQLGFQPEVFKKIRKEDRAKGVDVALTKDLLSNAYLDNYDVAVLYAGDGDYVPLVQEAKRLGKVVYTMFFGSEGMSRDLRLASDDFLNLEGEFLGGWEWYREKLQEENQTDDE